MTISGPLLHQNTNQTLMKKMSLQESLNEWGEDLPTYGSVVTKVVEKKGELSIQVMDWQNLVYDPVDFDSAPKIEKLTLTPAQLRAAAADRLRLPGRARSG
jgi:Ethanolamine utilization protein EutJ (predicted chaperonin)